MLDVIGLIAEYRKLLRRRHEQDRMNPVELRRINALELLMTEPASRRQGDGMRSQRKFARVPCALTGTVVSCADPETGLRPRRVVVRNVGAGGAMCDAADGFDHAGPVVLVIHRKDRSGPGFAFPAKLVWEKERGSFVRMGLEFVFDLPRVSATAPAPRAVLPLGDHAAA